MNNPFTVLPDLPLQPRSTFGSTTRPFTLVRLDSPATTVMTDFASVAPVTITPQTPIDVALQKMKTAGVRLLFVVNDLDEIIGLITAKDIMGERPIKFTRQTRVPRAGISVAAIMTPQTDIQVLDAARLETAMVGDIVTTLRVLERQHALVAKIDATTQTHRVIGMFSTSRISKLLGDDEVQEIPPARSLAEIVEKIG
jgi:CBS domain-containing protein